jgi:hypothetical protein
MGSFQIEGSKNPKMNEIIFKSYMQKKNLEMK